MNYTQELKSKQNNRKIGTAYEALARKYLEDIDYTILNMNYRCKSGEIDIISTDGEYIIFIEVKYRKTALFGYPRESVNYHKQRRIIAVAKYFLLTHKLTHKNCRFDVVEVLDDKITHIENAFAEG